MSNIHKYEPLWGVWYIEGLIGEGSFGKVYKVRREEFGKTWYSAVKIISLPQSRSEVERMEAEGLNRASIRSFYQALVADITSETDMMSQFRGNSHIVSFEDHSVMENPDGIGWDVLIRMELLRSLASHVRQGPLSRAETVRLGIHICRALERCVLRNIIHRDIKPDNIFVSPYGEYKLGDFGIARKIESTMSGLSKKGTYSCMAPEVYRGEKYGSSVDIYSLGIVLYSFLNQNRTPFLPDYPLPITPNDRDTALERRMGGEPLPALRGVSPQLNALVMKACAFNRRDRFESPTEMRRALEAVAAAEGYELDVATLYQEGSVAADVTDTLNVRESPQGQARTDSCRTSAVVQEGSVAADITDTLDIWEFPQGKARTGSRRISAVIQNPTDSSMTERIPTQSDFASSDEEFSGTEWIPSGDDTPDTPDAPVSPKKAGKKRKIPLIVGLSSVAAVLIIALVVVIFHGSGNSIAVSDANMTDGQDQEAIFPGENSIPDFEELGTEAEAEPEAEELVDKADKPEQTGNLNQTDNSKQTDSSKQTGSSEQKNSEPDKSTDIITAYMEETVRLVNAERAKNDLAPLAMDSKINAAAQIRAQECITLFSHTRPNGKSYYTVLNEMNVSYRSAGENFDQGVTTPGEVVESWMSSPGHRENILGRWTKIGVGIQPGGLTQGYIWVLLFVTESL